MAFDCHLPATLVAPPCGLVLARVGLVAMCWLLCWASWLLRGAQAVKGAMRLQGMMDLGWSC